MDMRQMMFSKKLLLTLSIVLTLVTVLSACGSGSDQAATTPPASNPPASTPPQETPKETPAAPSEPKSEWDGIVEAAKKEGTIVIAGPPGNFWRDALATSFNKVYPDIKVEYQGMSGRDLGPKIVAEQKGNLFLWDVTVGGANTPIAQLIPAGALDTVPRDLPETMPDKNDDKWQSGFQFGFIDKGEQYNYAFLAEIVPIFVNTKFVSIDNLKTAQDLLKPEFKGKIVWNNPAVAGAGNFLAQTMVLNEGEEFIKNLFSTQEIVVTEDLRQQAEWLVRGIYPIAIGTSTDMMLEFTQQGLTNDIVGMYDPKSGLNGYSQSFGTVSLLKNAPHPNAAKVYINWLLSKEGQSDVSGMIKVNSRRLDVPVVNEKSFLPAGVEMPLMGKEQYEPYRLQAIEAAKAHLKK